MKKLIAVLGCLSLVAFAQAKKTPAKTEVTWWGHAAFVVKTPGGATIAIDPWFQNPKAPKDAKWPEAVDAILITHGHFDHVGNAVELQKKTGAQVVGAGELIGALGLPADKAWGGNVGGSLKVKDATIYLVEAVHSSGYSPEKTVLYGGSPVGYIIQIENGPTLYHAGDTAFFSSMSAIGDYYKPTVAMLPIGGHYTMDPDEAAFALKMLKAKTVIPMHYGTFDALTGTPEQLQASIKKQGGKSEVKAMKPGETLSL